MLHWKWTMTFLLTNYYNRYCEFNFLLLWYYHLQFKYRIMTFSWNLLFCSLVVNKKCILCLVRIIFLIACLNFGFEWKALVNYSHPTILKFFCIFSGVIFPLSVLCLIGYTGNHKQSLQGKYYLVRLICFTLCTTFEYYWAKGIRNNMQAQGGQDILLLVFVLDMLILRNYSSSLSSWFQSVNPWIESSSIASREPPLPPLSRILIDPWQFYTWFPSTWCWSVTDPC